LSNSGPTSGKWRLRRPERLQSWVLEPTKRQRVSAGVELSDAEWRDARDREATADFILNVVLNDPDFGEVLDDHTRSTTVPGTNVTVIWTFDRSLRGVEIITPFHA
jgi:hypothetical protein